MPNPVSGPSSRHTHAPATDQVNTPNEQQFSPRPGRNQPSLPPAIASQVAGIGGQFLPFSDRVSLAQTDATFLDTMGNLICRDLLDAIEATKPPNHGPMFGLHFLPGIPRRTDASEVKSLASRLGLKVAAQLGIPVVDSRYPLLDERCSSIVTSMRHFAKAASLFDPVTQATLLRGLIGLCDGVSRHNYPGDDERLNPEIRDLVTRYCPVPVTAKALHAMSVFERFINPNPLREPTTVPLKRLDGYLKRVIELRSAQADNDPSFPRSRLDADVRRRLQAIRNAPSLCPETDRGFPFFL